MAGFCCACCLSPGVCGGDPSRAVAVRAVSCLAVVVASRAVLSVRAGEGGGLILPALAKSAPTLPSPPRHPGTARYAACGCAGRECGVSFSPFWCGHEVTPEASLLPWSIDTHQNGHHRGGNVSAGVAGCRPSPARPRPRRPGGGSGSWRSGAAVCGHRLR